MIVQEPIGSLVGEGCWGMGEEAGAKSSGTGGKCCWPEKNCLSQQQ